MSIIPTGLRVQITLKRPINMSVYNADGSNRSTKVRTLYGVAEESDIAKIPIFKVYTAIPADGRGVTHVHPQPVGRLRMNWFELGQLAGYEERNAHEYATARVFEWDNINPVEGMIPDGNVDGVLILGVPCENCACTGVRTCNGCDKFLCDGCLREHNDDAACHIDADRWVEAQDEIASWFKEKYERPANA
jgi:hypothetical protein